MQRFLYSLLLVTSAFTSIRGQQPNLFPYSVGSGWGYVNSQGEWVIQPQYDVAEAFTEGLAAVRKDGYYFYINEDNEALCEAKYAYAYPFRNDIAIVMEGEYYHLIDRDFDPISRKEYSQIHRRPNGLYLGLIHDEVEILGPDGETLLSPSPGSTWPFGSSHFIRHVSNDVSGELYDDEGRHILTLNELQAGAANEDYFILQWFNPQGLGYENIYRKDGILLLTLQDSMYFYNSRHYTQNPTPFERYLTPVKNRHEIYDTPREWGLLYENGDFKSMGDSVTQMTYMEDDRCFAQINNHYWNLLDVDGDRVSDKAFQLPQDFLNAMELPLVFEQGKALVQYKNRWVIIDRNGEILKTGPCAHLSDAIFQIMNGQFALFRPLENNNKRTFWNLQTGDTATVHYDRIFVYNESYLGCLKEGEMTYILPDGTTVLGPNQEESNGLKPLNIAAKIENPVHVSSPALASTAGLGGWGLSSNSFKPTSRTDLLDGIHLLREEGVVPWNVDNTIAAHTVRLINQTEDTLFFSAQDSRLYTQIEAMNEEGEWLPIEIFRSSDCGNSYHSVFLIPNHEWSWTVPEFEGGIVTKLRIKVYNIYTRTINQERENQDDYYYPHRFDNSETFEVYSEEWTGRINPSQFHRNYNFSPSGVKDTY